MLMWFAQNLSTIVVAAALAAVVAGIVVYLIKSKKQGKSSCGGNCAHCAKGCCK